MLVEDVTGKNRQTFTNVLGMSVQIYFAAIVTICKKIVRVGGLHMTRQK